MFTDSDLDDPAAMAKKFLSMLRNGDEMAIRRAYLGLSTANATRLVVALGIIQNTVRDSAIWAALGGEGQMIKIFSWWELVGKTMQRSPVEKAPFDNDEKL